MDKTTCKTLGAIAFITAIVCSTPLLERAVLLTFVSLLIIIFLMAYAGKKAPYINTKHIFICFLFIALMFMYNFLGVSDTSLVSYTVPISFLLIMLMTPYVPILRKKKSWKWLFYAMVIVMLLNVISNIYLCIRYPEINLATTREDMSEEMLANLNVGSTRFYSFTLFFFDVCFFVFLNCKEKMMKYFMLISSIITAIYICVFCLKATVVVYFLLSIGFLFFARRKRQQTKSFFAVVGIIGLLVMLLVMNYTDDIISFIVSVSPSERLTVRLVTLLDADNAAASSVTLTNRTDLYMLSVHTWLSSPNAFLFGIGDHATTYDLAATGIGHHSDFLDSLAKYGLVGLLLLYYILARSFKNIVRQFDNRYKIQLYIIFFIFILCGFTKAIFLPGVGCVMYLLLPLTSIVLENEK